MADVIAMCECGWCYYHWADVIAHNIVYLADVIAILVVDVITTV